MYNIPSPREPCRRTDKKRHGPSRPTESGVEWVYQKHTHAQKKKSRAGGRLAASNRPPARKDGGTLVSPNDYLLQVGSSVGGYVRYRPLGCVPTNRFVRPGLVNFDRAPGLLHPTPRQVCWKAYVEAVVSGDVRKHRSFRG